MKREERMEGKEEYQEAERQRKTQSGDREREIHPQKGIGWMAEKTGRENSEHREREKEKMKEFDKRTEEKDNSKRESVLRTA